MKAFFKMNLVASLSIAISVSAHVLVIGYFILSPALPPRTPRFTIEVVESKGITRRAPRLETSMRPHLRSRAAFPFRDGPPPLAKALAPASGGSPNGPASDVVPIAGSTIGLKVNYPRISRIIGEQGRVLIAIKTSGDQILPEISKSSGYHRLDESALRAIQDAIKNGQLRGSLADRSRVEISFLFNLTADQAPN